MGRCAWCLFLISSYSHPFILVIKFLSAVAYGCNISLVVIGVRVGSLAVVPGFHLGGGGCRTGVHVGDGGAAVFGGQARHAAEAVVGVVSGDGTDGYFIFAKRLNSDVQPAAAIAA
jgi:hypothetical protein